MLKGLLGGNGGKPGKQDREPQKDKAQKKREQTPQEDTPNHRRKNERPPPHPNPILPVEEIDILKFPIFPLKWPTPEMTHKEWYNSISLKKEDADYVVTKWWQKVQLFFRAYDPYVLQLEDNLMNAVKNVRRLRAERDAWKKEHDDVFVMYQKLKMAADKKKH
ncbi:hypothetical protein TWF718_002805 [Orbilia javanica]|uniref:Uncharacterized protein n=1 Tax=Orbilia javanica TaxID=47235 RepID=A0AAN8MT21_9PEZI